MAKGEVTIIKGQGIKDATSLKNKAIAGFKNAKRFAGKNKAALIASGVGLAGAGGAYALGKHQNKNGG